MVLVGGSLWSGKLLFALTHTFTKRGGGARRPWLCSTLWFAFLFASGELETGGRGFARHDASASATGMAEAGGRGFSRHDGSPLALPQGWRRQVAVTLPDSLCLCNWGRRRQVALPDMMARLCLCHGGGGDRLFLCHRDIMVRLCLCHWVAETGGRGFARHDGSPLSATGVAETALPDVMVRVCLFVSAAGLAAAGLPDVMVCLFVCGVAALGQAVAALPDVMVRLLLCPTGGCGFAQQEASPLSLPRGSWRHC